MAAVDIDTPAIVTKVPNEKQKYDEYKEALREVLKKSIVVDGLVHGIHQACKALDKRQALLCVLAPPIDEPDYVTLVAALCKENRIPLLRVESNKLLGEWTGLCKIDKEGKPWRVCGCSVVVVKDFGEETRSLDIVKEHLRTGNCETIQ